MILIESLSISINIWIIELTHFEKINYTEFLEILSKKEQIKFKNFRFLKDKIRYITTYIILRSLLAEYSRIEAKKIIIQENDFGKPFIQYEGLHFNISHSNDKAVIAFSNNPIGIDIEFLDKNNCITEISKFIFSKKELQLIQDSKTCKSKIFYNLWTRKEALLKAIGIGLINDLLKIDISDISKCYRISISPTITREIMIREFNSFDLKYIGHIAFEQNTQLKKIKYFQIQDFFNFIYFKHYEYVCLEELA